MSAQNYKYSLECLLKYSSKFQGSYMKSLFFVSAHILKSFSFYLFFCHELNNKLEIVVVGKVMSAVPVSMERKSPVASLTFVPEIDGDPSSPA
jgi:hypothetical protein